MVLREPHFPSLTREEAEQYWDRNGGGGGGGGGAKQHQPSFLDFDYHFPPPDAFAFVWSATDFFF